MRRRIAAHFRAVRANDDVVKYATARRLLDGDHLWLERGMTPMAMAAELAAEAMPSEPARPRRADARRWSEVAARVSVGRADAVDADTEGRVRALHVFSGSDGGGPNSLSAGSAGLFYGTTYVGGANDAGVLFQIDRYGNFTVLHDFDLSTGSAPIGAVIEGSDGNVYGTASYGGFGGYGTGVIFRLALPLRVLSVAPASGDALGGAAITVSGRGFSGRLDPSHRRLRGAGPGPHADRDHDAVADHSFPGTLNDVVVTSFVRSGSADDWVGSPTFWTSRRRTRSTPTSKKSFVTTSRSERVAVSSDATIRSRARRSRSSW